MSEGYISQLSPAGGVIHPLRRRADASFHAGDAHDFAGLARLDWVSFSYGSTLDERGRRCAVGVRHLVPESPRAIWGDATLARQADEAERLYEQGCRTIARRWEDGGLSVEQRAALFIDLEHTRLTRLRKLIPRATGGAHDPATTAIKAEHEQERQNERESIVTGIVRNTNERGYAFLRSAIGDDYFMHASQLVGIAFAELRVGDTLTFQTQQGAKGPIAVAAERVKRASGFSDEAGLPDDPAPRPWPTAAGRAVDAVTEYDWGAAS